MEENAMNAKVGVWLVALLAGALVACESGSGAGPDAVAPHDTVSTRDAVSGADLPLPRDLASAETQADSGPDLAGPPPLVCAPGLGAQSGAQWVDVTHEVGLDLVGFEATKLAAADVDGDGYPDLVLHGRNNNVNDNYYILFNRPDGQGGRRFVNLSPEWRFRQGRTPEREDRRSSYSSFADFDNDGDLDLFSGLHMTYDRGVQGYRDNGDRNEILLNQGDHFVAVPDSGVNGPETIWPDGRIPDFGDDTPWPTVGAAIFDHDRDGVLDLFIANFYIAYGRFRFGKQHRLFKGAGDGTFTDITEAAGLIQPINPQVADDDLPKPAYGVSHCDVNDDGWQDILIPAYGRQWNDLFVAQGDGRYANEAAARNFRGDELRDFTDNQMYLCHCERTGDCEAERPSMNCAQSVWSADDEADWRLNGNTFGAYCFDVDEDGDLDVLLTETTHWWAGDSADRTQLLLNQGAEGGYGFVRADMAALGLNRQYAELDWNEGDHFFLFLDYDNDGRFDLYFLPSVYPNQYGRLFRQKPDHTFEQVSTDGELLGDHDSEVAVALDYDLDGDLDVVVGHLGANGHTRDFVALYRNEVGSYNNWIRLRLVGAGAGAANRDAIGARILLHVGDRVLRRDIDGPFGRFGQQNPYDLLVGLEGACQVDRIEIRWPDAALSTSVFEDVRANYRVVIEQATNSLRYDL